ncbi:MAG: DUF4443 domain-containing protein [Candidatus Asgardarchaeia archaeon]
MGDEMTIAEMLSSLERGWNKSTRGLSKLSTPHLVLALLTVYKNKIVGRYKLMDELGIGEASAKTLLKNLNRISLLRPEGRDGHVLTEKGAHLVEKIKEKIIYFSDIEPLNGLTPGPFCSLCVLRGCLKNVRKGIEQRDSAVFFGAMGALTLVFDGESISFPNTKERIDKVFEEKLKSLVKLEKGDVLIISFAKSVQKARLGSIAASLTLLHR